MQGHIQLMSWTHGWVIKSAKSLRKSTFSPSRGSTFYNLLCIKNSEANNDHWALGLFSSRALSSTCSSHLILLSLNTEQPEQWQRFITEPIKKKIKKNAQVTYDNHVLLSAIKIKEHCVGLRDDASEWERAARLAHDRLRAHWLAPKLLSEVMNSAAVASFLQPQKGRRGGKERHLRVQLQPSGLLGDTVGGNPLKPLLANDCWNFVSRFLFWYQWEEVPRFLLSAV